MVAALVTVGCGRSSLEDELDALPSTDAARAPHGRPEPLPFIPATPLDPTGTFHFGPMVQKGFAGTWARLADLSVTADGKLSMLFGEGCGGWSASGTWSQANGAVRFDITGTWTNETGQSLEVSSLTVTAEGTGLRVRGMAGAVPVDQLWDRE